MATVNGILMMIDRLAPFKTAESWDNVGLLVGDQNATVNGILLALDVTEEVITEALLGPYNLIITHHPIIFGGIKSVTTSDRTGRLLLKLIENGVSVIAAHTNWDRSFEYGINRHIANLYGLKDVKMLNEDHGFGIIGSFDTPISIEAFSGKSKAIFKTDYIKFSNLHPRPIKNVSISSGASSDFISDAIRSGADLYVTADLKYHEAQSVIGTALTLVDVGHFESEFLYLERFKDLLEESLSGENLHMPICVTKAEKPVFQYL